uniref:Chromosome 2 open reading frame 78 n=1 Tax=Balaenoptera musculus TaxID=9771 RepID=A0A8C0D781_BALMU
MSEPYHLHSLPVVSNATSLTPSVCNFSRVSAPAVSSASATGTPFQTLMGSAYLYQHSSTTMLSGVTDHSQISTSAASYPGVLEWDITGSTEKNSSSLGDFTLALTDRHTAASSMFMAAQYDKTSDANNMVPLYPSLSASLAQGTPSQIPNQGHSRLSLPYQEGSQVYHYNQGTRGSLLYGELGSCPQSYGSASYTGSRASVQPEMGMGLKEIQPTNIRPPASTSAICHPVSAQLSRNTSLVMKNSLGLQPPSQTFCVTQTQELPKSCSSRNSHILESNPPSELGDISVTAPVQSARRLLALPPAPSQGQIESKNVDDIKTKLSKPLDAYQIPIENQDPPLLPSGIPDIRQPLACTDPLSQEEQPGSENADLGENSRSRQDLGTLENGTEPSSGLADITTLAEGIHLPQLFNPLKDLDQSQGPNEKPSVIKVPSDQPRKNKQKASEPISGAPKAKIQPKNPECLLGGEVVICHAAVSDRAPVNTAKHSQGKPQKAASRKISKTKSHGQEKTKRTRGRNKAEENKQSGNKVKAEEKPAIPNTKRKEHQTELLQQSLRKPRTSLGVRMLESVKVLHALGKKNETKTGLSSCRLLGNSSNPKDPQPPPAIQPWRHTPREGKSPEKTQVQAQKPDSSAETECPAPSQYERPPPGKVKLIPLPFSAWDKPQARPAPRRPQSLASRRPAGAYRAQPGSTDSAQPAAVNSAQPAPASLPGPAKPAQPTGTNPSQPAWTNHTQPRVPQSAAAPRPAPYKTSSGASLQREPVPPAVNKRQSPPKLHTQFLLQDFSKQRVPWREPNVPEPVMSKPIEQEQRPEREAMKRRAQQQRENAARYTSSGKLQFFTERENEMEIADYYGYVK